MSRNIRSKYQQYKLDTLKLSTWLAQAAIQSGYGANKFQRSNAPLLDEDEEKPVTQSKNAKKKKAKAKSKVVDDADEETQGSPTVSAATDDSRSGDYVLFVKDYISIAEFLAEKDIDIPVEFGKLLSRCITLRKAVSKRFQDAQKDTSDSHNHFIATLEQVQSILRLNLNGPTPSSTPKPVKISPPQNRFSPIEPTDDEDYPDIDLPPPPQATAPSASGMRFAPDMDRGEGIFAILQFYADVHSVRDYIRDIWAEYRENKVDLVTAAVVTNTGLELLQRPHNDLMKRVFPVFNNDLGYMLGSVRAVLSLMWFGQPRMGLEIFCDIGEYDIVAHVVYDYLLLPTLQIVNGQGDLVEGGQMPMYKPGFYGNYDNKVQPPDMSIPKRWDQYQILLAEAFTDIYHLLMMGRLQQQPPTANDIGSSSNLFFVDQFLYSMSNFLKTQECTLYLVVTAQVFCDINLVLGNQSHRGLDTLTSEAKRMVSAIGDRRKEERGNRPKNWDPQNEKYMDRFLAEAEHFAKGEQLSAMRKFMARSNPHIPALHVPSTFLARAPVLCGILLFRLQLEYHDIGLKLSNTWASLQYTCHLYTACKHSGTGPNAKTVQWSQMDKLLELHGDEAMFGGTRPQDLDESNDRFMAVAGYSKESRMAMRLFFTETQLSKPTLERIRKDDPFKQKPLPLKDESQILPIFYTKYILDTTSDTRLDIKYIEKLLHSIEASSEGVSKLRKKRKHRAPKFSILQLLSVLEAGLKYETRSINFDYLGFHVTCLKVLRIVRDRSHEYLTSKYGEDYLEDDSQLPFVVGWILQRAMLSNRASRQFLGDKGKGVILQSRLLVGASEAITAFLASNK